MCAHYGNQTIQCLHTQDKTLQQYLEILLPNIYA